MTLRLNLKPKGPNRLALALMARDFVPGWASSILTGMLYILGVGAGFVAMLPTLITLLGLLLPLFSPDFAHAHHSLWLRWSGYQGGVVGLVLAALIWVAVKTQGTPVLVNPGQLLALPGILAEEESGWGLLWATLTVFALQITFPILAPVWLVLRTPVWVWRGLCRFFRMTVRMVCWPGRMTRLWQQKRDAVLLAHPDEVSSMEQARLSSLPRSAPGPVQKKRL
jgi:hypothetical protein